MRMLCFNCRGLGSQQKRTYIKNIIAKESIQFACLQETKMENIKFEVCQNMWGTLDVSWIHKNAENSAGGILTIWDDSAFKLEHHFLGNGFVYVQGIMLDKNQLVVVVNVYSTCSQSEKRIMWEDLLRIKEQSNITMWCMLGDFNAVRKQDERIGCQPLGSYKKDMKEFNEFIENMELFDIPMIGRRYTWYRTNGEAKSRLDRTLMSLE